MFPGEPHVAIEGFDVLERLGAGSMGEVFLARSRAGTLVAVKTVARGVRGEARPAESFAREASVCARLQHECIVQLRAVVEQEGLAALVFEYVPGVALTRVLRICEARGVRLPDRAAWHVVERVLAALAYAHRFRAEGDRPTPIVHRDLSPSNVLVGWDGAVKISDFGIAKVLGVSPMTRVGLVKGTLGCMAPEQARGEPVDERADVYAAALLGWRLATGRTPFAQHAKDEFELLRAMRNPRLKPLDVLRPDLPAPLLLAFARALEPDPGQRAISAAELGDALRAHADVGAGQDELRALLASWRPALVRGVKRASDDSRERSSDEARATEHTVRYADAALAFDDEMPPDAPTVETHALPSEPFPAAAPVSEEPSVIDESPMVLPPVLAEGAPAEAPAPAPPIAGRLSETLRPARRSTMWAPMLAIVVLALTSIVTFTFSTCAR